MRKELGIVSLPEGKEETERLLDDLSYLLTSKGMDKDWEPNEFGLKIEELIDLFSAQLCQINDSTRSSKPPAN